MKIIDFDYFGLEKVDGFRENSWKSSTFPVFGPIEHLIQLGSCVIAWFFPFQREKFSRRASERRRFGGRAASARALEPFTAPACVERSARAHEKPSAKAQRACAKSCDSSTILANVCQVIFHSFQSSQWAHFLKPCFCWL